MKLKYGVEYGMQNKDIHEKARRTLYLNGKAPTSKQQNILEILLEGY
ncbi:hypothetical protein CV093_10190 [Oceanobacillus sp. 143]|nr:hypothetical protein CV093_10190 [Oceanobacillus sp. 143]